MKIVWRRSPRYVTRKSSGNDAAEVCHSGLCGIQAIGATGKVLL
jgi:hypothetical protein